MVHHVGIDLGTTYSCIAVVDPSTNMPRIIKNMEDEETTPSVVLYNPDSSEIVVGQPAKSMALMYPDSCFEAFKRDMGREGVCVDLGELEVTPQVLSAYVLKKIIDDFKSNEEFSDYDMDTVTITCPAYFDQNQKMATKQAGELAGFKNIHILEEPIAAAISYGALHDGIDQKLFVYDLGGGTFDVTILEIKDGRFITHGVKGNSLLGGKDWDMELENLIIDKILENSASLEEEDVKTPDVLPFISEKVETFKKKLSASTIVKEHFTIGTNIVQVSVTRNEFNACTEHLLNTTKNCIDELLKETGYKLSDMDKFLLVGGSTKMPQVREMLERDYPEIVDKIVIHDVNLAVAKGAALYQEKEANRSVHVAEPRETPAPVEDVVPEAPQEAVGIAPAVAGTDVSEEPALVDDVVPEAPQEAVDVEPTPVVRVMPHAYGVLALNSEDMPTVVNVVYRQDQLPVSNTKEFYPKHDGQTEARVAIYQNEGMVEDGDQNPDLCTMVGEFVLALPFDTLETEIISITITADENGDLVANSEFRGVVEPVPLQFLGGILSAEEMKKYRLE